MNDRPRNVIILHSDEMRADCTGFNGNTEVRTPCLDAFAKASLVCQRHFTVHGKCVPSRVAMMTGRFAHSNGARTVMEEDLIPHDRMDLMKRLKSVGFETAVFGLNHCWDKFFNDNKPHGVVDWHSYVTGDFQDITNRSVRVPLAGARADTPSLNEGFDLRGRLLGTLPAFNDDVRTDAAIHYLRRIRDRGRPFFMQLNLSAPHPPYAVEEPWYSAYDPAKVTPFPQELPAHAALPLRAQRKYRTGEDAIGDSAFREVLATYYGMISKVDALMGRVIECIRQEGLMESSIVIFTSDHGDFAGQYGLCEKFDTVMADCLLRVPCIIHASTIPAGATLSELSQHTDLPSTVLDLLGIPSGEHWNIQGSSLVPVIAGTRTVSEVFADGGHESAMRARFNHEPWITEAKTGRKLKATGGKQLTYQQEPDSMARCSMVRTNSHKLVMRETGEHELYELLSDTWELCNRYGEPALQKIQQDLMERLVRWQLRTMGDQPYHPHVSA